MNPRERPGARGLVFPPSWSGERFSEAEELAHERLQEAEGERAPADSALSGESKVRAQGPKEPQGSGAATPRSSASSRPADELHTCHFECPCHTGGEPTPDFLPSEGSLLPGLFALARLRRDTGQPFPWEKRGDEAA